MEIFSNFCHAGASFHFLFLVICSTSPPGGNQVDGLPPAASFEKNYEKNDSSQMDPKFIQSHSWELPGLVGHQKT